MTRVLDIAHRGASHAAPENTLAAFALAIEQGADMIETDLHLSRDRAIPLFHDAEIGGVRVGEATLDQLRDLKPDLPTLDELLELAAGRIELNLELKRAPDRDYPGLEERVLAAVNRHGLLSATLFSSFYDGPLSRLRHLEARARIGLLLSARAPGQALERAARLRAESIHPELGLVTGDALATWQGAGYRVHVYTVDRPADQQRLVDLGVDGIFTNEPARLRRLLGPSDQ
ncbi:MAG: glycerophosphodiester phosphodiesterase [Myxococcota bacterium]